MRYFVEWAGRLRRIEILPGPDGALEVLLDGKPHAAEVVEVGGEGLYSLLIDGNSFTYGVRFEDGHAVLSFHDRELRLRVEDERTRAARLAVTRRPAHAAGTEVRSVMPGIVREVRVAAGNAVEEGAPLVILEAMKMQNEVRAPRSGLVEAVAVAPGQAVEKGALLVALAAPPG